MYHFKHYIMETNQEYKIAVLIDADNVPHSNIKEMLDEISKYGTPTIKRIYGDWTSSTIARWKPFLLKNAITPIQQCSYTSGKNATDSAMIIDAMDILHSDMVDAFCLISSDSDFTRLATRIRESGKHVFGMGERKTPIPFIASCDKFTYIEILRGDVAKTKSNNVLPKVKEKVVMEEVDLLTLLNQSVDDVADEEGWAFLGEIGSHILKKCPDFDPRNYNYKKLSLLMESFGDHFTVERRDAYQPIKHVYVKRKDGQQIGLVENEIVTVNSCDTGANCLETTSIDMENHQMDLEPNLESDLDLNLEKDNDLKVENDEKEVCLAS